MDRHLIDHMDGHRHNVLRGELPQARIISSSEYDDGMVRKPPAANSVLITLDFPALWATSITSRITKGVRRMSRQRRPRASTVKSAFSRCVPCDTGLMRSPRGEAGSRRTRAARIRGASVPAGEFGMLQMNCRPSTCLNNPATARWSAPLWTTPESTRYRIEERLSRSRSPEPPPLRTTQLDDPGLADSGFVARFSQPPSPACRSGPTQYSYLLTL